MYTYNLYISYIIVYVTGSVRILNWHYYPEMMDPHSVMFKQYEDKFCNEVNDPTYKYYLCNLTLAVLSLCLCTTGKIFTSIYCSQRHILFMVICLLLTVFRSDICWRIPWVTGYLWIVMSNLSGETLVNFLNNSKPSRSVVNTAYF